MKKNIYVILLLLIAVAVLNISSCSQVTSEQKIFEAMDTFVTSTVVGSDKNKCIEMLEEIESICVKADGQISKTIESSDIYKLNNVEADTEISAETASLLNTAKYIKEITDGAYEPALGKIIDLWGISGDNDDNKKNASLPMKDEFYSALNSIDSYVVEEKENSDGEVFTVNGISNRTMSLDLGGIGKGYALDRVNKYLKKENSAAGALISFGSSVLAAGNNREGKIWTIGLKNPLRPEYTCGYIGAANKIISVSGGYERYIEIDGIKYCHIIDPATGYPVDNDLLCTVVVMDAKEENSGAVSDALSTALYVMGKQNALNFYAEGIIDFEMILFVKADNDKGYEVICTSVNFTEIEENNKNNDE